MTGQLHALLSPVKRPEVFTRAKIGTFAILGAECIPCAGPKNSVARNVVHVDRNSQQRRQRNKQVTDVTRRQDAMVGSLVIHDFVRRSKRAGAGQRGCKPGRWPSRIGSLIQNIMDRVEQLDGKAFSNLQSRSQP